MSDIKSLPVRLSEKIQELEFHLAEAKKELENHPVYGAEIGRMAKANSDLRIERDKLKAELEMLKETCELHSPCRHQIQTAALQAEVARLRAENESLEIQLETHPFIQLFPGMKEKESKTSLENYSLRSLCAELVDKLYAANGISPNYYWEELLKRAKSVLEGK